MLVDFSTGKYFLNQQSPNADVLRVLLLQRSIGESEFTALTGLSEQEVTGEDIRYVDWLVPGVIGMNMLFSCLFGVAILPNVLSLAGMTILFLGIASLVFNWD
jgi:ABC-2 type transport system permease protein